MCQYVYELSPHRIAHYKSKCLIICRYQIDSHGKFRKTEMLFYTLHKYYFSESSTRTVHITSFQYQATLVFNGAQPCYCSSQENTKGFAMTFNGVRKLSVVVEVGQLAQKLKWDTHKYIMVFTGTARKVSSHFEYLETRSRILDVTWQPVRRDLTVHP